MWGLGGGRGDRRGADSPGACLTVTKSPGQPQGCNLASLHFPGTEPHFSQILPGATQVGASSYWLRAPGVGQDGSKTLVGWACRSLAPPFASLSSAGQTGVVKSWGPALEARTPKGWACSVLQHPAGEAGVRASVRDAGACPRGQQLCCAQSSRAQYKPRDRHSWPWVTETWNPMHQVATPLTQIWPGQT